MLYFGLLFCLLAGILKESIFPTRYAAHSESKNLLDFLVPGIYDR